MATFEDFQKLDIRVGEIVAVEDFPEAHTLGVPDESNECILIAPDKNAPVGAKLY